jgi:hypothetical protein
MGLNSAKYNSMLYYFELNTQEDSRNNWQSDEKNFLLPAGQKRPDARHPTIFIRLRRAEE